MLGNIESDDAKRVSILSGHQIGKDAFQDQPVRGRSDGRRGLADRNHQAPNRRFDRCLLGTIEGVQFRRIHNSPNANGGAVLIPYPVHQPPVQFRPLANDRASSYRSSAAHEQHAACAHSS